MSKHSLSLASFATLVCMMLFAIVSCKKDDPNGSESSNDFFVNVDFLPETETNGKVAPRLMVNFNDETVMIELRRPSTSTPMESVLFLFPDNKATMMCGNDNLMVCAEYDMETLTPSDDVLLVTQMDDNALLLTKCVMNWNTNTMTKGDQMVLPIDGTNRIQAGKSGDDGDMRKFFFTHFIKPLTENLEQLDDFYTVFNVPQGIVVSYINALISTTAPIILFSDDPEEFIDAMEYPITSYTETAVQTGLLHFVPQDLSDMASRVLAGIGWFTNGGHGTVDENEGNGEANKFPFSTIFAQSTNASNAATQIDNLEPVFTVKLYVFDVTENSAKFSGSLQYNNTNTSPIEMGYIYKVSGGNEHTVEDMGFHGKTVSGLQKATKYTAYAYARSVMGDLVLSPGVTFMTLGFEAFPSSLIFPTEGDTKYVGLSYSEEDITDWDITSKPSWCTINKVDDRMFTVKVDESTETRNGTIVVTGYSQTLGNVTENIPVTQLSSNGWDGTHWRFEGLITITYPYGSPSTSQQWTTTELIVTRLPWVEFDLEYTLSNSFYLKNNVLDENGNLIHTATAHFSGGEGVKTCRCIFVRTGLTTATADFYLEVCWDEATHTDIQTFSGLLQGTLIN